MNGAACEWVDVDVGTPIEQELEGKMKIVSQTLKVATDDRVELYNITERVQSIVQTSGVQSGFIIISSLHTTTALFIN